MTGVKAQHIPYRGTGPALSALLAQEYRIQLAGMLAASRMSSAGRLRALAIVTRSACRPCRIFPPSPSRNTGFEVVGWYGVFAPAKLPAALLAPG